MARYPAVEQPPDYLGSGPGGPPGVPAGGITGVELGFGTGAGCTIFGSTPSTGLMTPPLLSNLSLRLWFPSDVAFSFCVPPRRGETNPSLELSDCQPDHQAKFAPRLLRFLIRAKA